MLVFSIKTVAWFEPELDGFLRSCRQKCISGTSPLAKRTVYMKLSPESPVTEPASSNSISMISPFSPCRRVLGPLFVKYELGFVSNFVSLCDSDHSVACSSHFRCVSDAIDRDLSFCVILSDYKHPREQIRQQFTPLPKSSIT